MKIKNYVQLLLLSLLIISCSEDNKSTTILINIPDFVPAGNIDKGDHLVVLFQRSEKLNLIQGYNDLYLMFVDGKTQLKLKDISFTTRTYMLQGTDEFVGATFPENKVNSLDIFKVPTYFTKSTNSTNVWFFEITYKYKNKEYIETIQLEVSSNLFFSEFNYNDKAYYISQINPQVQSIGIMDFDLSIIEKIGDNYKYSNDFTTKMIVTDGEKETTNNVSPIFQKDGFYKGTIFVPNIGTYQVECDMILNGVEVYKHVYPIIIKTTL